MGSVNMSVTDSTSLNILLLNLQGELQVLLSPGESLVIICAGSYS